MRLCSGRYAPTRRRQPACLSIPTAATATATVAPSAYAAAATATATVTPSAYAAAATTTWAAAAYAAAAAVSTGAAWWL